MKQPAPVIMLPNGHQDLSHLDDWSVRPISGGMGALEPCPRRGQGMDDQVFAWGEVIVKNGDTEFRARNKITGQGLRHFVNSLNNDFAGQGVLGFATNALTRSYIRVGTGTGSTIDSTVALITQVATNPNSTSASLDNPTSGQYRAKFTATWNSGTLTAVTVTEIGIFAAIATTLGSAGISPLALLARLSTTDGEFSSFTVNTAVPLTIEYRVVFTFT